MLSVHLQHDALASREKEQKVHPLSRKRQAMAQSLYDSGVIVKVDLRQERRSRLMPPACRCRRDWPSQDFSAASPSRPATVRRSSAIAGFFKPAMLSAASGETPSRTAS